MIMFDFVIIKTCSLTVYFSPRLVESEFLRLDYIAYQKCWKKSL